MAADTSSDGNDGHRAGDPTNQADPPYPRRMSPDEIRSIYAEQVGLLARFEWVNRLLTGRYRRRLFSRAEGRVLDVACGTGTNRQFLPATAEYVGIDISPEMLRAAQANVPDLTLGETLFEMDAQALAFATDAFDTVISSLSTCTFPDPVAALTEMRRVCDPDGRILLFEHGRSDVGLIAGVQDWRADAFYERHACRWNQEPLANVERAGLSVRDSETAALGIITAIEAGP